MYLESFAFGRKYFDQIAISLKKKKLFGRYENRIRAKRQTIFEVLFTDF